MLRPYSSLLPDMHGIQIYWKKEQMVGIMRRKEIVFTN